VGVLPDQVSDAGLHVLPGHVSKNWRCVAFCRVLREKKNNEKRLKTSMCAFTNGQSIIHSINQSIKQSISRVALNLEDIKVNSEIICVTDVD
jgi:hypothetical protein